MGPSLYRIALALPGRLYVMAKPSTEWLGEDIDTLGAMGVSGLISLLTPAEAAELGLAQEESLCRSRGLDFKQHPIPDRGLADRQALGALAAETLDAIAAGASIAVHCRAGIGRSGMLACYILILHGLTAEEAIARVTDARGVAVPDTDAQAAFIRAFGRPDHDDQFLRKSACSVIPPQT